VAVLAPRCPGFPPNRGKTTDFLADNGNALGPEECPFQAFIAPVAPQQAARRDDPMAGDPMDAAALHDVSDGAGRAGLAGDGGNISVSGDLPGRNTPDCGKDTLLKRDKHEAKPVNLRT
jgi:hypothetical protein